MGASPGSYLLPTTQSLQLTTSASRLPGRDPQSPIVQHPAAVVKLLAPALPLHFANPSLRLRFAHLVDEGLPEHANPVLQPALALFEHRGPVEERRFPHLQAVLLEQSRIFRHARVKPRTHSRGWPHAQCRECPLKSPHQLLNVALAAELGYEPSAGLQYLRYSGDHFLRLRNPVQHRVGKHRIKS